jgi:hypothetical protein
VLASPSGSRTAVPQICGNVASRNRVRRPLDAHNAYRASSHHSVPPDDVNATMDRSPSKPDLSASEAHAKTVDQCTRSNFLHKVEFRSTFRRCVLMALADRIPSGHAAYQRVLRDRDLHVLE